MGWWSGVTDVLGSAARIASEVADVPGAVFSGRWGDIPGEIVEAVGTAARETGLIGDDPLGLLAEDDSDYYGAMGLVAPGGGTMSAGTSTAQGTVNGAISRVNGSAGPSGPVNGVRLEIDPKTGRIRKVRARRRRRRLLTATDKADIAFIVGQLGSGQLGRAAISALLSRRV